MTKWLIASLTVGTIVLGIIVWPTGEPTYQDKPFSYWLTKVRIFNGYDPQTLSPFQAMGSNAIPFLVKELRAKDFMLGARAWLRSFAARNASSRFCYDTAADRKERALAILEAMGHSAAGAAPIIEGMVTNNQLSGRSDLVLARMGTPGLFPLVRARLRAPHVANDDVTFSLWNFLNYSGDENGIVTASYLRQKLNDPSAEVRRLAAYAVTHIAWLPERFMPELEHCLDDPDVAVRLEVVAGLADFNSRTAGGFALDEPAFARLMHRAATNSANVVRAAGKSALRLPNN